ncbi:Outer dense fiber 3 [Gossypium arboreum]|uniref:Outer dense fiber 3 n=1 Tax=Gossypium arboreum TaxID=29729 RepID=A0A0B0NII9_GOSAR|nr:Outer dense fiber 3 [Gossypium arboreum]
MVARVLFPLTRVIDFGNVSTSTHSSYCAGDYVTMIITGGLPRLLYWQLCCIIVITGSFAALLVCWLGGLVDIPTSVSIGTDGVLAGMGWAALSIWLGPDCTDTVLPTVCCLWDYTLSFHKLTSFLTEQFKMKRYTKGKRVGKRFDENLRLGLGCYSLPNGHVVRPCAPCTLINANRMPSRKHTGRDTAVCLSRVKSTTLGHGCVPRPCEVCTYFREFNLPHGLSTRACPKRHGRVNDTAYPYGRVIPQSRKPGRRGGESSDCLSTKLPSDPILDMHTAIATLQHLV